MDLLNDLNKNANAPIPEELDKFDLPDHITEQLVEMTKEVMQEGKFTDPLDAALYVVRIADLAGLEGEDDIQTIARTLLDKTGL